MKHQKWVWLDLGTQRCRCLLVPNRRSRSIRLRLAPAPADLVAPEPGGCRPAHEGHLEESFSESAGHPAFIVKVSHPPHLSEKNILAMVQRHQGWIEDQGIRLQAAGRTWALRALVNGATLYFRGRALSLDILPQRGRRPEVEQHADSLRCYTHATQRPALRRLLEAWYRQAAEALLREDLNRWSVITAKPFRVMIRGQRSRWGSCSTRRTLSFNWRLAEAPDEVRQYVVIHELAHLEVFNHSKAFWALVGQHCPEVKQAKAWLKQRGLHAEW